MNLIPWQAQVEQAISEGARAILIMCGRKAGKTEYLRYRMTEEAKEEPLTVDQVNPYIAPSRAQAKNIMWRRIKAGIPREAVEKKPRESDLIIDLRSGTRIQLFGSEYEDAIRGLTFGPTKLDEADFMRPGFWEEVAEPNLKVTKAPWMMASSPKNGWFTKLWREVKDGRRGRDHVAFHFTTYDNPHISREEIENTKKKVTQEVWQQEYMANPNAYGGLQYSEFNAEHIVKHREPMKNSLRARSLDWGWDHPSHCLWGEIWFNKAVNRWNLYIYREFSARGMNVASLVAPIITAEDGLFFFTVIDSAAKRTEISTGQPILKEFHSHGLLCRVPPKDDNFRINAAKMMLKLNDVQISENCPLLIKQLREVEWGQQKGDDAADAFKYFCSMVYQRDFSNVAAPDIDQHAIDPRGILAVPEPDAMVWGEAGYLA